MSGYMKRNCPSNIDIGGIENAPRIDLITDKAKLIAANIKRYMKTF